MSYNLLAPFKVIDSASMGSSITSDAVEIKLQDNVGFQLNWTGSPVGSFDFQISADHKEDIEGNVVNEGNWISLTLSASITAAGSPDSAYVDLNQLSASYARVRYIRTSGSGTLDVYATAKGV